MIRETGCAVMAQEPVASEVLKLTERVASMAEDIANRLCVKLEPVMISSSPQPDNPNEKVCREYPQLFSKWNSYICAIRNNLEVIDDAIRRTEL